MFCTRFPFHLCQMRLSLPWSLDGTCMCVLYLVKPLLVADCQGCIVCSPGLIIFLMLTILIMTVSLLRHLWHLFLGVVPRRIYNTGSPRYKSNMSAHDIHRKSSKTSNTCSWGVVPQRIYNTGNPWFKSNMSKHLYLSFNKL